MLLQLLSKRIHSGKFVAEAKFRGEREKYSRLIAAQDAQGIMDALTKRDVELQVSSSAVLACQLCIAFVHIPVVKNVRWSRV